MKDPCEAMKVVASVLVGGGHVVANATYQALVKENAKRVQDVTELTRQIAQMTAERDELKEAKSALEKQVAAGPASAPSSQGSVTQLVKAVAESKKAVQNAMAKLKLEKEAHVSEWGYMVWVGRGSECMSENELHCFDHVKTSWMAVDVW